MGKNRTWYFGIILKKRSTFFFNFFRRFFLSPQQGSWEGRDGGYRSLSDWEGSAVEAKTCKQFGKNLWNICFFISGGPAWAKTFGTRLELVPNSPWLGCQENFFTCDPQFLIKSIVFNEIRRFRVFKEFSSYISKFSSFVCKFSLHMFL